MTGRAAFRAFVEGRLSSAVWASLIARSVVDGQRFPVGKRSEDAHLWIHVLPQVRRYVAVDQVVYMYRLHGESFMRTLTPRSLDCFETYALLIDVVDRSFTSPRLRALARGRLVNAAVGIAIRAQQSGADTDYWHRRGLACVSRVDVVRCILNPLTRWKTRILGFFYLSGPSSFSFWYKQLSLVRDQLLRSR